MENKFKGIVYLESTVNYINKLVDRKDEAAMRYANYLNNLLNNKKAVHKESLLGNKYIINI